MQGHAASALEVRTGPQSSFHALQVSLSGGQSPVPGPPCAVCAGCMGVSSLAQQASSDCATSAKTGQSLWLMAQCMRRARSTSMQGRGSSNTTTVQHSGKPCCKSVPMGHMLLMQGAFPEPHKCCSHRGSQPHPVLPCFAMCRVHKHASLAHQAVYLHRHQQDLLQCWPHAALAGSIWHCHPQRAAAILSSITASLLTALLCMCTAQQHARRPMSVTSLQHSSRICSKSGAGGMLLNRGSVGPPCTTAQTVCFCQPHSSLPCFSCAGSTGGMRFGPGVAPLHDSAKLNAPTPPAPLSNGASGLQPVTYRALLADVLNSVLAQALANPSGASMMAMFGVGLGLVPAHACRSCSTQAAICTQQGGSKLVWWQGAA